MLTGELMTFVQFKSFVTVVKHMSVTKAAQELHTSQPSISKHLKTLQHDYNVKLFTRKGKVMELSPEGIEFLKYVDPILAQLEKVDERFRRVNKKRDRLILGGTPVLSSTVLSSLIGRFMKRHADVEIVLRSGQANLLEQMILKRRLEIALTTTAPKSAEIAVEPCLLLQLCAFAAKDYPLNGTELKPRDFERLRLIVRETGGQLGITESLLHALREAGCKPTIALRCESLEAIKSAVGKKLGVDILYKNALRDNSARRLQ
jgi:LysR family transcriptional regulator, transcriptional activator of the cysJI operon